MTHERHYDIAMLLLLLLPFIAASPPFAYAARQKSPPDAAISLISDGFLMPCMLMPLFEYAASGHVIIHGFSLYYALYAFAAIMLSRLSIACCCRYEVRLL